jgi:hypothetical protein
MRPVRYAVVFALVLVLFASASAEAAPGKGKKNHESHGVVAAVEKDKDKDSGTLTLKIHPKKNGVAITAPEEKTFKITPQTTFAFVSGKKGQQQTTPATFADVRAGEHVVILYRNGVAAEVKIHKGKQK